MRFVIKSKKLPVKGLIIGLLAFVATVAVWQE
jgi:hypothetical protein